MLVAPLAVIAYACACDPSACGRRGDAGAPAATSSPPAEESAGSGIATGGAMGTYPSAPLADPGDLDVPGFGSFRFQPAAGIWLDAYTYRAARFDPHEGRILFVQHGAGRNADGYVERAAPLAERHQLLVVGIEFNERDYPNYHVPISAGRPPRGARFRPAEWPPIEERTCAEMPRLYRAVSEHLGNRVGRYWVHGHSGGAQFVHRMLMFCPDPRLASAVAANAGWYTLPTDDERAGAVAMPFGLAGTPLDEEDRRRLLQAPLTVLIGDQDRAHHTQDGSVCSADGCVAQGENRYQRAHRFVRTARTEADRLGVELRWQLFELPGVGHEGGATLAASGQFLFGADGPPCRSTSAADAVGLVVNELLISAPREASDDINGDGAATGADEFVELVNTGPESVCLSGWTLGDATQVRHRFPLGLRLDPGEAVVAFGRCAPVGDFGGARISWSTFTNALNLSDLGDVLRVRDADGETFWEASWGDCDEVECARDHIELRVRRGASFVREPDALGPWRLHPSRNGRQHSPGTRSRGGDFAPR